MYPSAFFSVAFYLSGPRVGRASHELEDQNFQAVKTCWGSVRRNKNLSDQLVRASTRTDDSHTTHASTHTCNHRQKCRYCPKINHSGFTISKTTGRKFYTLVNVNCQSSNLIYLITFKYCSVRYVGQTKNRLLTRFQGHHFDIQNQNDTTVSRHYNKCPSLPARFDGLVILVLQFMRSPANSRSRQIERDREERRWIHRLAMVVGECG